MTDRISITEAARILRVTTARIHQLSTEGVLQKQDALVSLESVCRRAFVVEGDWVLYRPLKWRFEIHRPAVSWWPVCGAKKHDGSASVSADCVPPQLQGDPDLAAKIARLALDFADR